MPLAAVSIKNNQTFDWPLNQRAAQRSTHSRNLHSYLGVSTPHTNYLFQRVARQYWVVSSNHQMMNTLKRLHQVGHLFKASWLCLVFDYRGFGFTGLENALTHQSVCSEDWHLHNCKRWRKGIWYQLPTIKLWTFHLKEILWESVVVTKWRRQKTNVHKHKSYSMNALIKTTTIYFASSAVSEPVEH